ncbi:hypothetical protein N9N71_02960 [Synechococcus sp. AH-229-G18]|nr:hypothetical protein [Synechococcus sp. AH-229-G18]
MTAWQYFTPEEEKDNFDYFVEIAPPKQHQKVFFLFVALGLMRLSGTSDAHILCRPLRVVERWTESSRTQAKLDVEELRLKITKKNNKPVSFVQKELAVAA